MKLDDVDKVWATAIKYFLIALAAVFLWVLVGSARAEIEAVIPTKPSSVAVQVCNNSSCSGHGSGFHLYSGYFVTAGHVTKFNKEMWIKNSNGQQQPAIVLWTSRQSDYSLLYVEAWDFLAMPENTITCEKQEIGEEITIVGYPADLGNITTKGVILGIKDGTIGIWVEPYIADITIFFGSSGGPAINSKGEVFGVAVGALAGTSFSLIEDLSRVCDILPKKRSFAAPTRRKEEHDH